MRTSSGFAGVNQGGIKLSTLSNLGNTCYLNSVVYALRFLDEFRKLLHEVVRRLPPNMKFDTEEKRLSANVLRQLHELFRSLSQAEVPDVIAEDEIDTDLKLANSATALSPVTHNPVKFLDGLRAVNNIYEGFSQHDAHELMGILLSCVDNVTSSASRRRPKGTTYSSVFGGLSILRTVCQECENYSEVEDVFWNISIPSSSFYHCETLDDNDGDIPSTFKMEEIMRDDNKIWCDHCYQRNEAYRFCRYRHLPSLLIIQLMKQSLDPRMILENVIAAVTNCVF